MPTCASVYVVAAGQPVVEKVFENQSDGTG